MIGISPETLKFWKTPTRLIPRPPLTKARLLEALERGPAEHTAYGEGFRDCRESPGLWWRLVDWWKTPR